MYYILNSIVVTNMNEILNVKETQYQEDCSLCAQFSVGVDKLVLTPGSRFKQQLYTK